MSQMGDYDNKEVFFFETHAWRRGAGWVYEYGVKNEKIFSAIYWVLMRQNISI